MQATLSLPLTIATTSCLSERVSAREGTVHLRKVEIHPGFHQLSGDKATRFSRYIEPLFYFGEHTRPMEGAHSS